MGSAFLTGLHINKVRHLENIDIPLSTVSRKHLILTGRNGSGKTSTLAALTDTFEYIEPTSALSKLKKASNVLGNDSNAHQLPISCQFSEDFHAQYVAGQFILARFDDARKVQIFVPRNIENVKLKPVYGMSDSPSKELAKYMVGLKATEAFAKTAGKQQRADEIEAWFQRFETILRRIYDDGSLKLHFDIENFQFSIQTDGREPFDFNTMSMGYAAVFDIIGDLIMRMESQHRYDLEGIVLIDEIETHLHVELQKQIVPLLTELFPNIQFIMSTHSPFVLNSAPNSVIYDLEKHILVENGLTNLPYEGIVEGYFGVDLLSQELREKFEQYRALAQKPTLDDEDFAKAVELEMYLDEIPDYLALDLATEYNQLKLEFANRG